MKILIAGDFVVTDEFQGQDLIDESVVELFEEADYSIINLEAPITPDYPANKILKTGPHLRSSPETTLPYLKQLKVDMVTLANNHVLDYGEQGLYDTIGFCTDNIISTVGAGNDLKEARNPKRIEIEGKTISIINFAENEWSSATADSGGAHPMDIIDNARLIQSEKDKVDFVFLIIHGGHEYYHYPSPRMQKQYRFYTEQGADVIVGHHTHCISGYEMYNDTPIFYSLGNFLFTKKSIFNVWYSGLVLELEIKGREIITNLIPIVQNSKKFTVSIPTADKKSKIIEMVKDYSKVIQDSKLLNNEWDDFVDSKTINYLNHFSTSGTVINKYVKSMLIKSGLSEVLTQKKARALSLNLMRCEAHSDLSKKILTNYLARKSE